MTAWCLTPETEVRKRATFARERTLRLTLSRHWDDARPGVCFIGHNPSTADALRDDPTVRRWMQFARAWGYGGFTAVNLYPFRAANPAECRRWADWESNGPDWYARDDLMHNAGVVAREAKNAGLVVACWGAIATDADWIDHILEEIQSGPAPWPDVYALGVTAEGAPVHPMARGKHRVPNGAAPVLWRRGHQ